MILVVDIGNTMTSLAVVEKNKVFQKASYPTNVLPGIAKKEFKRAFFPFQKYHKALNVCVVCSVVPRMTTVLKKVIQQTAGLGVLVVGQQLTVPIKNQYRQPNRVGPDRLVCAYAAAHRYGVPVLVVDLGTAITFDVVSKKNEYLGGIIVPGIRLTAESLFEKTALLPRVEICPPKELIGRDTKNSILSGIFYGYGSLCDGLIQKISKKIGCRPRVILTGGYAELMRKFITTPIEKVEKDLIFQGMSLLFEEKGTSFSSHP